MRPKPIPSPAQGETDMFRNQLDNMIDMRHELVRLAGLIDWRRFDEAFGTLYAEKGRPGLSTRLMVGLHLLKHARGVSDEQVCAQWIENAYFQFFCGETYFQTELPLDRTSMSVWRGRIGADKLEVLLSETLAAAMRAKAIDIAHKRVNVSGRGDDDPSLIESGEAIAEGQPSRPRKMHFQIKGGSRRRCALMLMVKEPTRGAPRRRTINASARPGTAGCCGRRPRGWR